MKRGLGKQTAAVLSVHPSTVSRNKDRVDISQTAVYIEQLNTLNKTNDIQPNSSNSGANTGGQ